MRVPRFWVSADGEDVDPRGRPWRLRVWGWSSESAADAAQVAAERLRVVLERVRQGTVGAGGRDDYYPRTPPREEVLRTVEVGGDVVAYVTRNRYGAMVLTTDRVLVADVDRDLAPPRPSLWSRVRRRLGDARPQEPVADLEREALDDVRRWARSHPELGVRTYRTAAGLRVLVTGSGAVPGSELSEQVLADLGTDRVYVALCGAHGSYRARLTPKPWRIGLTSPRRHWPAPDDATEQAFARWLTRYDTARTGYATCRLLAVDGPQPDAGSPEAVVVAVHDDASGVGSDLPLA
ncbi:hypothetical protein [Thalassiella azotivora]